jgi:hypothetical protein
MSILGLREHNSHGQASVPELLRMSKNKYLDLVSLKGYPSSLRLKITRQRGRSSRQGENESQVIASVHKLQDREKPSLRSTIISWRRRCPNHLTRIRTSASCQPLSKNCQVEADMFISDRMRTSGSLVLRGSLCSRTAK